MNKIAPSVQRSVCHTSAFHYITRGFINALLQVGSPSIHKFRTPCGLTQIQLERKNHTCKCVEDFEF